jgi:hypothetical protein
VSAEQDRRARLAALEDASWASEGGSVAPGSGTDEFLAYCLAPLLDRRLGDDGLLAWWHASRHQYPTLARMARDFLAMQASSGACERQFSGARWVVRPTRQSLRGRAIQARMCLDDWFPRAVPRPFEAAHHRLHSGVRVAAAAAAAAQGGGPTDLASDRFDLEFDPPVEP